jgi:hypothetical protein
MAWFWSGNGHRWAGSLLFSPKKLFKQTDDFLYFEVYLHSINFWVKFTITLRNCVTAQQKHFTENMETVQSSNFTQICQFFDSTQN